MTYRDAGKNYFQTSESLATSERKAAKSKNQHGKPIRLPSKILALHQDPYDPRAIYVAEAAGNIKRVVVETGEKIQVLRAPAPLTSIALSTDGNKLFAGCWDKQIYVTDFSTGVDSRFSGHTDFVKCLLATSINGTQLLISGSADSSIIVWDVATSQPRYRLKGHTKAVQDLAVDPFSWPADRTDPSEHFTLFSSSSDREIRRWHIALDQGFELEDSLTAPICAHETGVWQIRFDASGDLWTASADKTAQHLVRSRAWAPDTTLPHPDYVKDVVISETLGLAITACRDEDVRVWDTGTSKLLCTYSGHFEEVTALLLSDRNVVSASIDGTIRRWSLDRGDMTKFTELLRREASGGVENEPQQASKVATTADEDAELEALMMEDD